jgi:dTDP-4-amino-4,6-dideoxygalactose transaminase
MFSFHATKVFNTIEGGAISFSNEEYGLMLYRLKNFGIRSEVIVDGIGANAKMNEFQAAMGICNLRHVVSQIEKRKRVVERYRENLENVYGIHLSAIQPDVQPNYAYFPIMIDEKVFGISRNEIYALLKEKDIFARKYFYPLTNTFDCFHGKYDVDKTPVALHISKRILTLPLYSDLEIENVDRICDLIITAKR